METRPLKRILIANRGEIARRVIRTARTMGIDTVAVYAEPDAGAAFVREADRAVALGGTTSAETYLDVAKILDAARRSGAEAVHPGYGFLAERADFAQSVLDAELVWIGPSPSAIATMGDKLAALKTMQAAGVPTLPRASVEGLTGDDLHAAAEKVGFPLMVKASAGGGGKGMRVVTDEGELLDSVAAARRESAGAFGSDVVFFERFVEGGRHVEVQIFGDRHGTVDHLFERECSIQRRHQKIIEEAPSPFLTDEVREAMCAAAVAAGEAVDYEGAGTVEFIVGADRSFYFLEMNTRLQVEHPVTELVTGLDLVREQIRIAQGEPLTAGPDRPTGSAIEARLYAEDPRNDFLPSTGTLIRWDEPDGVRVDAGVVAGDEVSVHFDPLLAKVIAYGPSRTEAAQTLARALQRLRVHGVTTNRDFLVSVLTAPPFLSGDTTVDFIARHDPPRRRTPPIEELRHAVVAAALADRITTVAARGRRPAIPPGWRNNHSIGERFTYDHDGEPHAIEFRQDDAGMVEGTVDDTPFRAHCLGWDDPQLELEVDGVRHTLAVSRAGAKIWVHGPDGEVALTEQPRFPRPELDAPSGALTAPMNGTVVAVEASAGDLVDAGQTLVIIEAMKMEHRVRAPADGVVSEVRTGVGASVAEDEVLVVVGDPEGEDASE
jgi:propionyl-CoA carboxylase alpha chain